jgi:hypothetical protein
MAHHLFPRSGLLVALLAAAGLALVPAGATAHERLPGLPTEMGGPRYQVRPSEIDYTGDGSGVLGGFDGGGRSRFGHLHWNYWNSRDALATGAVWIDNCKPDCAAGHFFPHQVRAFAFRPRHGHFTRLTLHYRYQGKDVVDRRTVQGAGYGVVIR